MKYTGPRRNVGRARRLAVVAVFLPGCLWTSYQSGEELQDARRAHDERLAHLERGLEQERERLDAKIAELEQVLQRATQVVTRNSADVSVQAEQLREQVASLEGRLAELNHDLEAAKRELATQGQELEQRVEALSRRSEGPSVDIPPDKGAHFSQAERAFEEKDYGKARALFKAYTERYPEDARAARAQYLLAASYMRESRPATALGEYRKILAQYARSEVVNDALYDMATAFYELHACTDAKSALNALLQRKPDANTQKRVKAKLRDVDHAPKGYCTS